PIVPVIARDVRGAPLQCGAGEEVPTASSALWAPPWIPAPRRCGEPPCPPQPPAFSIPILAARLPVRHAGHWRIDGGVIPHASCRATPRGARWRAASLCLTPECHKSVTSGCQPSDSRRVSPATRAGRRVIQPPQTRANYTYCCYV